MEYTKVRMLRNKLGSPDGIRVNHYTEDEVYEVPAELAASFVAEKVAEFVDGGQPADPDGQKAVEKAPKNKAVEKAPANKSGA